GAEREQLALERVDEAEDVLLRGLEQLLPRHAQRAVQLVHLAIGADAQIVLAHARAAEQAGRSVVPAPRVDLAHRGRAPYCALLGSGNDARRRLPPPQGRALRLRDPCIRAGASRPFTVRADGVL